MHLHSTARTFAHSDFAFATTVVGLTWAGVTALMVVLFNLPAVALEALLTVLALVTFVLVADAALDVVVLSRDFVRAHRS